MWEGYITNLLITSLITALVVSVAWILITRRYARLSSSKFQEYESTLREQKRFLATKESIISEKTLALRELFFQLHHKKTKPAMASVLGLVAHYWKDSGGLSETLNLLSRPNHHPYASVSIKQKERMDEYVEKLETICKDLHRTVTDDVKKFEHLQE